MAKETDRLQIEYHLRTGLVLALGGLDALEDDLAQARRELETAVLDKGRFAKEVLEVTAERDEHYREVGSLKVRIGQLEALLRAITRERDEAQKTVDTLAAEQRAENARLVAELEEVGKRRAASAQAWNDLNTVANELTTERESLAAEVERLRGVVREMRGALVGFREQYVKLEAFPAQRQCFAGQYVAAGAALARADEEGEVHAHQDGETCPACVASEDETGCKGYETGCDCADCIDEVKARRGEQVDDPS